MENYSTIIPNGKSRDNKPRLGELLISVVEQYAVHWEKLGEKLGLKDYQLANIAKNHASLPSGRVEACCRDVLENWLKESSPTWGKLDDVIKSLTIATASTGHKDSDHLKTYYKETRYFTTGEETWPPEQPKHFTPVVLIHQEGRQSKKETEVMTAATGKGCIETTTTTSKTTKNLQEIFSQLEQPSDNQHQRSVLVEGSPGVGKSVLLKHIAYLWAQRKLLTNTDFLFLLYLRDPSVQKMHSLDTLVSHFYYYDKQALRVTSCVAQDGGKSVTILLDGYDELPVNQRKSSFIAHILQRRVLPACSIVVSSRPHASTHLRDNISCQVEILGFSEEDQQHFIELSLNNQPHKISELKEYLKHHPAISDLCCIPLHMTILLFLYKNKEKRPLPTNSTGLYNLFICHTIYRNLLVQCEVTVDEDIKDLNSLPQPYSDIIRRLSKFAFKTLENNQLVFTLAEIKKECPDFDKAINGFDLIQRVQYHGESYSFNFIHLFIQEFLAAHHVTTLPPSKELSILQENFWNNAVFFNMFNIYVALTDGQRRSFKQFLRQPSFVERVNMFITGREDAYDSVDISKIVLKNKIKCLRMYHYFKDVGNMAMCKHIEDATQLDKQEITLTNTRLSPSDLKCLTVFFSSSFHKEWRSLNLHSCHIQDHGLQIFQHALRSIYISITWLELSFNDLTAVSSSVISDLTISCRAKTLTINYNKTVGEGDRLYRIITDDCSVVEELHMYGVNLSSSGAIKLFTALSESKKLRELWINNNNITEEAGGAIIMAMKKNASLVLLSIEHNPISGKCAQLIVQALQYNNTLQKLYLNDHPYDIGVKTQIRLLGVEVIQKRRTRGCQTKLNIYL